MPIKNIISNSTVLTAAFLVLIALMALTTSAQTDGGSFTDPRDGKTYRTVKIGDQVWMAENLNYDTLNGKGSWCYDDNPANCEIYGRLYNWYTAVAGAKGSFFNPSGVRGVCPEGWHLPSDAEWDVLVAAVGDREFAGTKLKSQTGWEWCSSTTAGTDDFGFSALPSGGRELNGNFDYVGSHGAWWSTWHEGWGGNCNIWCRSVSYNSQNVFRGCANHGNGRSVRCLRDDNTK